MRGDETAETASLAIATMTLARDDDERELIVSALESLAPLGVPVFATDGGSGDDFRERLGGMPHVRLADQTIRGLWPQVRSSLAAARASGAELILYTEPDKRDFFRDELPAFLSGARAMVAGGVILAGRTPAVNATFPPFQQYTEGVIKECCAEVIGRAFDYSYGPFLMSAALMDRLDPPREDLGWGWRHYTFGVARRLGLPFDQVFAAAACPVVQQVESNRVYRMQQMAESVAGLVLSTKVDLSSA